MTFTSSFLSSFTVFLYGELKAGLKRLFMSKINKAPLSLSRLIRYIKGKEDKIAVLVVSSSSFKSDCIEVY
ncbi:hypothetical protein AQUCO_00300692v1 [Aquilegia coerulea]|uniref:Large ribosomal subunit protein uL15/eL18 domain-containing protein n=1 Tax=Aquilegia coerulea TaxID=218851 RepID=A0A2G5F020_AQUCA|nr:hypothetical protein AQUCO_00300692v1 [Aquilegia coerulea]